MDFVPEALGWCADAQFQHGEAGGAGDDAGLAVCVDFRCVGIKLDPVGSPALDEFAGSGNRDMPKVMIQLHG